VCYFADVAGFHRYTLHRLAKLPFLWVNTTVFKKGRENNDSAETKKATIVCSAKKWKQTWLDFCSFRNTP
jgi:hypothetical protein